MAIHSIDLEVEKSHMLHSKISPHKRYKKKKLGIILSGVAHITWKFISLRISFFIFTFSNESLRILLQPSPVGH